MNMRSRHKTLALITAFSILGMLPEEISHAHYRWPNKPKEPVIASITLPPEQQARAVLVTQQISQPKSEPAPAPIPVPTDSPALFVAMQEQYTDSNGNLYLRSELRPICACESSYEGTKYGEPRQYENGRVLRGYRSPEDIGMCQISLTWHGDRARNLGADVFTPEGNIAYSNYLYEIQGSTPWYKSEFCWGK